MRNNKYPLFISITLAISLISGLLFVLDNAFATAVPQDIPYPDQREAVDAGVSWLIDNHQNEDGGYGLPNSTEGSTLDAVLAIASAGYNPDATYLGRSDTPIDFLRNNVEDLTSFAEESGGSAGKVILALSAANQDPRDFAAKDWVLTLTDQFSSTGEFNTSDAFNQSLAIVALAVVNEPVPTDAVKWLKDQQASDGSWDDGYGTVKNADTTAMSIMALAATKTPTDHPKLVKALEFLDESQLKTGGWEYGVGYGENANSTALVIQALAAVGEDFYSDEGVWGKNGRSPMSALLSWQNSTGAFQADFGSGPFDDFFSTVQSIPAATGKPLPLPARLESARRAVACLATLQDTTSGGWEQFAGFGVNAAGTARAIEAIAAVGNDPQSNDWTPGDVNAVDALEDLTPDYLSAERGGRVGVVIHGVTAAGEGYDVTNFAGMNLPLMIAGYLSPTGEYANTSFGVVAHDEAMLGLLEAGETVHPSAIEFLRAAQIDGDWGGADSNGISLNALGRLGVAMPAAIRNLRNTQAADGGWGFGGPSDPSSTSEVVQGLVQSNENPFSPSWSKVVEGTITNAADTILAQQDNSDCWQSPWAKGIDDPFGTTDAIMLLVQQPDWTIQETYLPAIKSKKDKEILVGLALNSSKAK